MMKIIAAVTIGVLALSTTPALAATNHSAQRHRGCAVRRDYRKVHKGQTIQRVRRELHQRGHLQARASSGGYRSQIWNYRTCSPYSAIAISYSANAGARLRVDAKSAVWVG
jgi:hypothetical protein